MKNNKSILNYPGSKKRLLDFIINKSIPYIRKDKYFLDIFAGTGSVAKAFQDEGYLVAANDVEKYSYNIFSSILRQTPSIDIEKFVTSYTFNKDALDSKFKPELQQESDYLNNDDVRLIEFNNKLYKIWHKDKKISINGLEVSSIADLNKYIDKIPFCLFTFYYSGYYFGLSQSIEIDSIRYAIEKYGHNKEVLFQCLYFAMKEASFSKDGHMAQPLNPSKNFKRLLRVRNKQIFTIFKTRLIEITNEINSSTDKISLTFNLPFESLLNVKEISEKVGFIYADPPYTDMQYSRYFHLLNTITDYVYPEMTVKSGVMTTGLYAENRYQSKISSRKQSLSELKKLIDFSAKNNITLAFSYAYPVDTIVQAVNRYTMKIDDLIKEMEASFDNVEVYKEEYEHGNNRNSAKKLVFEYLIVGTKL